MPKARIMIRLKPTVLDAQGAVVKSALHTLGFEGVRDVHVGKYVEVDLDPAASEEAAQAAVEAMCQKLLANPVIEQYAISFAPDGQTSGEAAA